MLESEKSNRMTWRSEWMPHREKFSKKSLQALSSRNLMWDGVESVEGEEEDAPKRRGFRDGVDFYLGSIEQLTERKRERERGGGDKQKSTNTFNINKIKKNGTYAWKMHEHVTCKSKNIMGSTQSNPTSTHHFNIVSTHLKFMDYC